MYREIAGTDKRVRAIPGVRDRQVRAIKVRLYMYLDAIILPYPGPMLESDSGDFFAF